MLGDISFQLKGIICKDYDRHYSAILINMQMNLLPIEKGKSYYYNGPNNDNEVIPLNNCKDKLNEYIPFLALNEKIVLNKNIWII